MFLNLLFLKILFPINLISDILALSPNSKLCIIFTELLLLSSTIVSISAK